MKYLFTIMLVVVALATHAQAQTVTTTVQTPVATTTIQPPVLTTTVQPPVATTMTVQTPFPVTGTIKSIDAKVNAEIIASSSTKVVKGAPFSAEGISESVQVLTDGNRIVRTTTTKMFRDGEGRFRREGVGSPGGSMLTGTGGMVMGGKYVSGFGLFDAISIFDPVESVRYILNPSDKTARRFSITNTFTEGAVIVNGQTLSPAVKAQVTEATKKAIEMNAAQKANVVVMPSVLMATLNGGKTESLGTKTFEGVEAEGTRVVTTIEAGAIGNERPIEIVYERWYSKELDLIVYSRNYDPRFGEQTYRLVNINRSEPDRSLFTVPSDYKTVNEPPMKVYTTTTMPTIPLTPKPQ